ncbi:PTS sugar transporter subunit IIA [Companilactobacillus kimchii]|uniref:Galactitol PTS, EIIA n=2 Tax=Companilactobacillus kimchii TaxID=2801452 RepID=A0ABR5NSW4_9LACO|nr:PTS sugar transporter subunit IIA [Companilactobacillus kimchii]KAE9562165.1 PTS galactitol transporter subunit IIA [Companilactobacillus kimchii]KRK51215.1 galactitol PTS, EIIA [Companilactobacillus kimchii DSM 13961 = JCM 10707]OWF34303.1 Protein-N(pi)-phosphohistidine--sugar phosphotransferase [Companilactobacillus kimchii]GEO46224.1 PTS galactitol transporter subunit IIA [Companilactobacillus paralimentarius]
MDYKEMLKPDLVFLNVDEKDRKGLYKNIASKLLKLGYVKESYEEALNKREDEFPTGVVSEHISIALPHANPENINKPFVCVVTTKTPIEILQMGYNTKENADTFFFLGIQHSNDQLTLLQKFMALIQNKDFVDDFQSISDESEMYQYIQNEFIK